MNPKTRKTIVYMSLVAAVLYAVVNMGDKFRSVATAPIEVSPPQNRNVVKPAEAPIDIAKYSSLNWGRDPFRKETSAPATVETSGPKWMLNGILFDESDPGAIIDGKMVRIGSEIKGARVLRIERKKVTLEINGSQVYLTLAKEKS